MTLVALWDGKGGDGEGGTEHMVKQAKARGAKVVRINIKELGELKPINNPALAIEGTINKKA